MNYKSIFLFLLMCLLFTATVSFSYEFSKDTYFHDKLFGKTLRFIPSEDELVVVFKPEANIDVIKISLGLEEIKPFNSAMHTGIYSISDKSTIEQTIDLLYSDTMVDKVMPAFIDQEGYKRYCIPTRLTVRFEAGTNESRMLDIIDEVGSRVIRKETTPRYFTISAPENRSYFRTVRELYSYREVQFSEPLFAYPIELAFVPNDSYYNQQWNLNNTGQVQSCDWCDDPYAEHDVDAQDGWEFDRGSSNVVIGVLDTGMDLSHPDLDGNLLPRFGDDWDFVDPNDNSPDDEHPYAQGHGTCVSGIAAAAANNSQGIAGIAHGCRLMPLRVLPCSDVTIIINAFNYAITRRPDFDGLVLNNSWSALGHVPSLYAIIAEAYNSDILICFSAGNNDGSVEYPALYPQTMAIAATSPCDERKNPSSCDGEDEWGSNYGSELDCAAPGVKIWSTDIQDDEGFSPDDYFDEFNGTSAACPHVAALGALLWSLNTNLTALEIRSIINETCDQVGGYEYHPGSGKSLELGHGRINIAEALATQIAGIFSHNGNIRPKQNPPPWDQYAVEIGDIQWIDCSLEYNGETIGLDETDFYGWAYIPIDDDDLPIGEILTLNIANTIYEDVTVYLTHYYFDFYGAGGPLEAGENWVILNSVLVPDAQQPVSLTLNPGGLPAGNNVFRFLTGSKFMALGSGSLIANQNQIGEIRFLAEDEDKRVRIHLGGTLYMQEYGTIRIY